MSEEDKLNCVATMTDNTTKTGNILREMSESIMLNIMHKTLTQEAMRQHMIAYNNE
jgi:hypothetical protein